MTEIPDVLACDVGNTRIRLAQVKGDQVGEVRSFRVGDLGELGAAVAEMLAKIPPPRKIVAASVNPAALKALEAAVHDACGEEVLSIGRDLPLPLPTDLEQSSLIGVDRLCCAVAAFDRLGVACVVVDLGTAGTVDCVNGEGVFLGGAILPGLEMGARALHEQTALLPQVDVSEPDGVIGKDTYGAIVGGLVFGLRGAVRALVEAYAATLGQWPLVVATGGDADMIFRDGDFAAMVQAIVPDLLLRGVAIAYYKTLLK